MLTQRAFPGYAIAHPGYSLLNKQHSVKITIGSIGGIVLILYFFSFAMLVDKAPARFFLLETLIAILVTISFFTLNKLSFAWIKKTKGKKPEFKEIIPLLEKNDVDAKLDKVFERIAN